MRSIAFLAFSVFATSFASASLITSTSSLLGPSLLIDFEQFSGSTIDSTPVQVGGSISSDVVASTSGGTEMVYGDLSHGLGFNGNWDDRKAIAIAFSTTDSLVFTFNDGLVSGAGAFICYSPGDDGDGVLVEALAADNSVLESYNILDLAPIDTGGVNNEGAFRGIVRGMADIAAIRFSRGYVAVDDLRFTQTVPEPGSLCALGLGAAAFLRRRRK